MLIKSMIVLSTKKESIELIIFKIVKKLWTSDSS